MPDFSNLGKILIVIGILMTVMGIIMILMGKIPWLGKLPGDFFWRGQNTSFYFPLTTSIVISILATIILWLINRH